MSYQDQPRHTIRLPEGRRSERKPKSHRSESKPSAPKAAGHEAILSNIKAGNGWILVIDRNGGSFTSKLVDFDKYSVTLEITMPTGEKTPIIVFKHDLRAFRPLAESEVASAEHERAATESERADRGA